MCFAGLLFVLYNVRHIGHRSSEIPLLLFYRSMNEEHLRTTTHV
jgi:hypothetical protein